MSVIVYLDESGDHSLELVDKDFPFFALAMFICEETIYNQKISPAINQCKMDFFGHEAVIIHSRDIRKAQGDFRILANPAQRDEFYRTLNQIMADSDYQLIVSVIKKQDHKEKYGLFAENPYDLAMVFCMERLLPLLEDKHQGSVQLIAEGRGKKEDDELMLSFLRIANQGTNYIPADRFKKINFKLKFVPKMMNVVGTQLADLAAYPVARHIHNPHKPNPAYDIIRTKFYKGTGWIQGLKIFP
jgi:hypothetical protein